MIGISISLAASSMFGKTTSGRADLFGVYHAIQKGGGLLVPDQNLVD